MFNCFLGFVNCSAIAFAIPGNVLLRKVLRSSFDFALLKLSAYHKGWRLDLPVFFSINSKNSPFETIFVGSNKFKFLSHKQVDFCASSPK